MRPDSLGRLVGVWIVGTCILIGSARAATPAQPVAPEVAAWYNLVPNGGFEQGDELPAEWSRYPAKPQPGNAHRRDATVAHTGKASGLIVSVKPKPRGRPSIQWSNYRIACRDEDALILSGVVKTENTRPQRLGVHFYDAHGAHLGFRSVPGPLEADDWTAIRGEVSVPARTAKIGFVAYANDGGKTWFDDLAAIGTPQCRAIRATPTIDGELTDACWADDKALARFAVHTGEKRAAAKTRAWLAYDDAGLYVAFHCPYPKGATLLTKAKRHDENTWLDDSVEVFVAPHRTHGAYYQLAVNCMGVIRDSQGTATTWQSGARAATRRSDDAWTVELAIPYDHLGIDLDVGTTWGINLVRNDRVRGETVTWSLGGFHNPARFGRVALEPDLDRFRRASLARMADEKARRQAQVLDEIRRGDLPPGADDESMRLLSKVKISIAMLRWIAAGNAMPADVDWQDVRSLVTDVDASIVAARSAALTRLYDVGGTDQTGAFRVAITHALHKVRRTGPITDGLMTRRVQIEAARDETECFQLVVLSSGSPLKGVTVEAKPLTGPGGSIPVRWNRVGYVETARPCYAAEYVGWWPDPLLPPKAFDVRPDERQPLWFLVDVPPDAKAGTYTGNVTIRHAKRAVSIPVELRVRDFRLPRPGTLATAFGLYAWVLSRGYHGNKPYQDVMSVDEYARWCEFLGKRRLTPKNIGSEYLTRTGKGKDMKVDASRLRKLLTPLASRYFAPYSFCKFRLPSGPHIGKPGTASDPALAAAVVKAHVNEWKRQGLPPEAYLYGYDEPQPKHYPFLREAYARIRKVAPDTPIMQTINHRSPDELVGLVDIWCPLTPSLAHEFYPNRAKAGDTLWTYVCCGPKPPYANFFIDEPATDHRVLFWQVRQNGATGLLYWCVCWWSGLPTPGNAKGKKVFPDVPIRSIDHETYKKFKTNGDGLLVYPGPDMTPYSSIRLEVIRDGIEDYEYLAMLSRLVERAKKLPSGKRPPAEVLKEARALCVVPETVSRTLTDYTKDPRVILQRRRAVADMIERLTRILDGAD